jgi:hypothetical protein
MHRNIVSLTANLLQTASVANVQFMPIVRGLLGVSALAGLAMFFKPLLTGIFRALVLTIRPRLTREQKTSRRHMSDAQLLQRMINSSQGPSHAAELRALAARA